jgi:hypothetical protein
MLHFADINLKACHESVTLLGGCLAGAAFQIDDRLAMERLN